VKTTREGGRKNAAAKRRAGHEKGKEGRKGEGRKGFLAGKGTEDQ